MVGNNTPPSPMRGYTTERMTIYAATVATRQVAQRPEDAEIGGAWRPLDRMHSLDMKTTVAIALARRDIELWAEVEG